MMNGFAEFWSLTVDLLWGVPLVTFILITGIYFSYISGLRPLTGFLHAFSILFGKYDDKSSPGEVSHFQALTVALSGTIGMGNIAGVAIAINMGGAGAGYYGGGGSSAGWCGGGGGGGGSSWTGDLENSSLQGQKSSVAGRE